MQIDLGSLCQQPLFNDSQSWSTPKPEFTNCFCRVSLALPSLALLVVFAPYLIYLRSFKRGPVRWSLLFSLKIVLTALLVMTPLLDLLKAASLESSGQHPELVDYISPAVVIAAALVIIVLQIIEQSRLIGASAVQFLFFFCCLLTSVPVLYNKIIGIIDIDAVDDIYGFVTFSAYLGLVLLLLILTCVYDRALIISDTAATGRVFPEYHSSILSRLTFSWLDKSVIGAFKKDIAEEDVDHLDSSLRVQTVQTEFAKIFNPSHRRVTSAASDSDAQLHENSLYSDTEHLVDQEESSDQQSDSASQQQHRKLLPTLMRLAGGQLLLSWMVMLGHGMLMFVNPFLLNSLIEFVRAGDERWHGYLYTFLFLLVSVICSVGFHTSFQLSLTSGIKIRSALIAAIYRKALTLTQESRAKSTVGEIVNLMTVDANKISDAIPYLWCVVVSPVQIVLALVMLWDQLGTAVLAGMGVFVILIPVNFVIMSKAQKLEVKEMSTKDERLKLLNEVLNAMKVIKLYAWEPSFLKKIDSVRQTELGYLSRVSYLFVVVIVFWTVTPFMVMLITFLTFVYSGPDHVLTANKAFVSLTLFNILRFPITVLPWTVSESVNAYVSIKRIQKFLFEDDIDDTSVLRLPDSGSSSQEFAIEVDDATFAWKRDADGQPLLRNLNWRVKRGKLVAIVGKVGCGKSSLLQSVLGETLKLHGSVTTRGSMAYAPQEAWIQNLTVRDNILFGKAIDQARYERILRVCQLEKDLKLLSAGDETEIGERGINLSGGQKQRISLARAVYQDCDLYLLDDPLAAVDSHVGKKLFHEVIGNEGMLAGKTRLLVTHGVHWLPYVDEIIVIDEQKISESGTYDALLDHNGPFAKFLKQFFIESAEHRSNRSRNVSHTVREGEEADVDGEDEEVEATKQRMIERLISQAESAESAESLKLALSPPTEGHALPEAAGSINTERPKPAQGEAARPTQILRRNSRQSAEGEEAEAKRSGADAGRLIEEEGVESGSVSYKSYLFYIAARGVILFTATAIAYGVYTAINVLSSIWLSEWTSDKHFSNASFYEDPNNTAQLRELNDYYLSIYGIYGGCIVIVVLFFGILETYSALRASKLIHKRILDRLLRAPMSFFDTTPTGRIVNRFSKDMEVVDRELPMVINDFIECFMSTVSCIIVIAYTTPIFLTAVVPLGIIYTAVQVFYLPISRQSRRLDSKTRSPILTNFSESIAGAAVIRAFRQQERFVQISDSRVDNNARFYFLKLASNRWLGFRLEMLGNIAVMIASLLAVLGRDSLTPGLVGLSISYALQISDSLNWMVRQLTELETDSVAVERLNEYSNLDPEAPWETSAKPAAGWPTQGSLQFCNYATRYRAGLDLVLNGINVSFSPGHRIGIVGRTGAGKSSLTLALFRIIEAEFGHIEIDGVRIDRLGLHALRSALTILPQDPTVFSGTLRSNLDPFQERNDDELWQALTTANLAEWVRSLADGLEHECGEGGVNLSVGQRQLVCLARALLRKSRLLVLDEATAAVDLETDSLIMSTIKTEFRSATVLIIAHRLATIMDADEVLVLENGRVKEFDSPKRLLANGDSYFHFLAREANLVQAAESTKPDDN